MTSKAVGGTGAAKTEIRRARCISAHQLREQWATRVWGSPGRRLQQETEAGRPGPLGRVPAPLWARGSSRNTGRRCPGDIPAGVQALGSDRYSRRLPPAPAHLTTVGSRGSRSAPQLRRPLQQPAGQAQGGPQSEGQASPPKLPPFRGDRPAEPSAGRKCAGADLSPF